MKKILFLTNYPAPYRVEFFTLLGQHCDLTVTFEERPEEVQHRNQKWFIKEFIDFRAVFLKVVKVGNLRISFEILKFLKEQYDHIIIGTYSTLTAQIAILYLKINKISFWLEIDGGYPKNGKGIIEWWKRKLISSASLWLSPSQLSDQYLIFYGADKNQIVRYPFSSLEESAILAAPISERKKKEFKEELGVEEERMVLTVGQFIPRKANEILIEAAAGLIENTGVYIVGGSPTNGYLSLVEQLGVENVHFVAFKPKDELRKYYLAADVFAMPTREDIWGLVINEALAKGLPIVSTDKCVAANELVKDGENGFLVPVDEPEEMSEKINYLLRHSEKYKAMAEVCLKRIRNYTIEGMVKVHLEIFDSSK